MFYMLPTHQGDRSNTDSASPASCLKSIHYFIDAKKFPGEKKHVLGVVERFKTESSDHGLACIEHGWDLTRPKDCPDAIDVSMLPVIDFFLHELRREVENLKAHGYKHKIVIYATNLNGVAIFKRIASAAPDLTDYILRAWGGHQFIPGLLELDGKVDVVSLPRSALKALSPEQVSGLDKLDVVIVQNMIGVPHNIDKELVLNKYSAWQENVAEYPIPIDKPIVLVVLGGDAPTATGEIKQFTIAEAEILAAEIAGESNRFDRSGNMATIFITDHPRTGPGVKDAFLKVLADKKASFSFYPYNVVDQNGESAYLPLLGAVNAPGARLRSAYVTGESTSMASEMSAVIPWVQLCVVQVGSMNESHLEHMHDMIDTGSAIGITLASEAKLIPIRDTRAAREHKSAAEAVVATITTLLEVTATVTAAPVVRLGAP